MTSTREEESLEKEKKKEKEEGKEDPKLLRMKEAVFLSLLLREVVRSRRRERERGKRRR